MDKLEEVLNLSEPQFPHVGNDLRSDRRVL